MTARLSTGAAVLALTAAAACSGSSSGGAAAARHLDGVFRIAAGNCSSAAQKPTGSYLEVLSASQSRTVRNRHGGCANSSYTVLTAGSDGGLVTGEFQDVTGSQFDADGNSRAGRIITPVRFGRWKLGFATSGRDQQDAPAGAAAFPRPAAIVSGKTLHVDLRSLVVTFNGRPGSTCKETFGVGCWQLGSENATGTYDEATGHYEVEWLSGRSFTAKGDSVEIHLEGTFVPRPA